MRAMAGAVRQRKASGVERGIGYGGAATASLARLRSSQRGTGAALFCSAAPCAVATTSGQLLSGAPVSRLIAETLAVELFLIELLAQSSAPRGPAPQHP